MQTSTLHQVTLSQYEAALEKPRQQIKELLTPLLAESDAKTLLLFWIHYSAHGVGMTEPVEKWIEEAGENCKKLGYQELGKELGKHAIHEADHHLLMIEDTKNLVNQWNKLYTPTLTAAALLNQPTAEPVLHYQNLHRHYIEGTNPYCQIAIEYEIENLSATYGPPVLNQTFKILGKDIKECLSFVDEHAKIDVAHTNFNRKVISNFITLHPETVDELIDAGKKALKAYGDFLSYCYQQAKVA